MPSNNTNKEGSTPACYGASDNSRNMNDPSPPSPTPVEVIDAPEPSSEEDIQLALDRLLNCATTLLRNNINRNQQGSLKEILRINPQLCKQIKDSPEDLLGNLEAPSVQIMQGLIRGFQKELTPIPVENADGNLYAGSIIEGLNPSDEINVIINLDPARVNLETRGVINYQTYHIHDTDAGEGSEEERQIKESLTQAFNQVLKCLAERKRVLIHCMEGKNRTGTLITIVKAHLEGKDFDTAWEEFMTLRGRDLGANPTDVYRRLAEQIPGLELIGQDNCCLPVPAGITEAELDAAEAGDGSIVKQTGHMEHITDRDGPSASSAVALAASLEATDRAAKQRIRHQLETVNDDERPVLFDSSQFEDSAGKMAKKFPATPSHTGDGGESIVYPRRSEIEDEIGLGYINTPRGEGGDEESPPADNEAGIGNNGAMDTREQAHQYTVPGPTEPQLDPAPAPFYEVDARLVVESEGEYGPRPRHTEETVYEATLVRSDSDEGRSYCKRHKRMILVGTLTFITGVAVAIGLTVPKVPPPVPPASVPTPELTPVATLPPPPPIHGISKIRQLGSFFESECGNDRGSRCWPYVEVNGNTAVVAPLLINPNTGEALDSPAWFQQIHILNKTANGTFETIQVLDVDYQPGHMKLFGDTLAIGANWETLETGAVYMYERNTSGLWNQVQRIVAPDSRTDAEFGYHVGLYFDRLVIGAYQDREGKIGSIYIYQQKEAGAWELEGEKIAPPDDNKIENFGMAVSINGNRVAVGDRAYGGNKTSTDPKKGAVWVYKYDTASKNWSQLNDMIRNDDCPAFFGVSLDFTFDYGLLIGCPMADKRAGAVYYYEPSGTGYVFRQKITASDKSPSDKIGMMEQISVYGNVMVVGTDTSREGSVYVFLRLNGAWIQVKKIESPADEARKFGTRVALSENNLVVSSWFNAHFYELIEGPSLIGCMASHSNGAIFDHECTICDSCVAIDGDTIAVSRNRESLQILSSIVPTLEHSATFSMDERFGGVAVSKDAIIVGTPDNNYKTGAVTVFQKKTGKWFESAQLTPDGYREHFGGSVDIDQKKVIVGAYNYQTNIGSVYVFHLNETSSESTWVQEAKLVTNDPIASGFGQSVSINNNFVAVGDRKYNNTAGAVFVYSYNGTSESWNQFNKTVTNSDCDNEFGSSVVLMYDNCLMIGCLGDQSDTGAVYYYTQAVNGDHFILQQKLTPLNGAPNDKFGGPNQIAVSGNLVVVGTDKEMNGTVHVFAKVNGAWLQVNTINSPPESRRFGYRVAISGLKVLVASVFNVYSYTLDQCEGA